MNASMADAETGQIGAGAWPAMTRYGSPGRLDPYNPTGALLFDTSEGALNGDAIDMFFATELETLDWLTDYLMDDSVLACEQDRGPSFSLEQDAEEEHYDKKAITTTESDSGWDIM